MAGITITYVMGDNSIFNKASEAKLNTELAKIEEQASLIYTDKLLEKAQTNFNNKPTMQEIVEELNDKGYIIEQVVASGNTVAGISLDKESMSLGQEKSNTIQVTLEGSNNPYTYYVKVDGKYYQMHFNGGIVAIDRTERDISGSEDNTTQTLTVSSSDENLATATVDNTTKVVTVTAKNTIGTVTITVSVTDGSNKTASCVVTIKELTVADIVGEIQTSNKTIKDENGNKVAVPGGFKVVPNGIGDVEYTYNGDGSPTVQDGIVIEDEEGNQFVWIPVGDIKNKDNTTTTITLGRYTFDTTNGTPTLVQNATNYATPINLRPNGRDDDYQELTNSSPNTPAKNLGDFVIKTQSNGGYYLGRYEASRGSDGKVDSQVDKTAWDYITQYSAGIAAQGMYQSSYIESDLINSYSWDTAIVFIQENSGNSNYANKTSVNTSLVNTGKSGDKVCNIHDMASNCREWSTEFSIEADNPSVDRGGAYFNEYGYTRNRYWAAANFARSSISFRVLLYVK